jgi:hypothetical protein
VRADSSVAAASLTGANGAKSEATLTYKRAKLRELAAEFEAVLLKNGMIKKLLALRAQKEERAFI